MRKMKPLDSDTALVVEIQEARADGATRHADRLFGLLLASLDGKMNGVARHYARRDATFYEDLQQRARMELVKAAVSFDIRVAGSQTFENYLMFKVRNAVSTYAHCHRNDVNTSHGSTRGRTQAAESAVGVREVVSRDAVEVEAQDERASRPMLGEMEGGSAETPEDLYDNEEQSVLVRRVITGMRQEYRDVLYRAFGFGSQDRETSFRQMERDLGVSRSVLAKRYEDALVELRRLMKRATR